MWKSLPTELQNSAYEYQGEFAWAREHTLQVLELFKRLRIPVLGVEVWLPTRPAPTIPTPIIYQWTAPNKKSGELRQQFVERIALDAQQYVRDFSWDPKDASHLQDKPFFNVTIE